MFTLMDLAILLEGLTTLTQTHIFIVTAVLIVASYILVLVVDKFGGKENNDFR